MAKTRLLHAACTVAMLAAVPAFAQSSNTAGQTGSSAMPQTPSGQTATPNTNSYGTMSQNNSMAPADQNMETGTTRHSGMHRSAMGTHSRHMMSSSRTDTSQNAAVDQLNDQSLRAARQGQAFNATGGGMQGGGSSGTMNDTSGSMNNPSGSMNDMSGGSMSGNK
jgi:hypothetical protein